MSNSPSYSPAIDILDNVCENLIEDPNPITNPFYYAQDRDNWYAEVAAKSCEEYRQQNAEEQTLKKKKNKSKCSKKSSFIIRKESGQVHHLIKICIHNLDNQNMDTINTNPDNAGVNVQYLVTDDYDDIMIDTEHLVSKIVKKLGKYNL